MIKMPLFPELQAALKAAGIDLPYLAEQLGVTLRCVQLRFGNIRHSTWRLEEQYQILRMLGEDESRLSYYFPCYRLKERSERYVSQPQRRTAAR